MSSAATSSEFQNSNYWKISTAVTIFLALSLVTMLYIVHNKYTPHPDQLESQEKIKQFLADYEKSFPSPEEHPLIRIPTLLHSIL